MREKDEYDGAPLYWNRDRGSWGLHQFATVFSNTEQAVYRVPEGGMWEWAAWRKQPNEYWVN